MKYAADFRKIARDALKGRWTMAVIAGLLAVILGAVGTSGPELNIELDDFDLNQFNFDTNIQISDQTITLPEIWEDLNLTVFLVGGAAVVLVFILLAAAVFFVLGSIVKVGYCQFNLNLVDRQKEPELGTLFGHFKNWRTPVAAGLLQGLYIFLWSLLLIVPGIIAAYSYAMTGYILSEYPEMTASEAITRSKEMMAGNRWRLFCLQISFIGWSILCGLTAGIGNLWLVPYEQAATAAFYREISETGHTVPTAPQLEEPWQNL